MILNKVKKILNNNKYLNKTKYFKKILISAVLTNFVKKFINCPKCQKFLKIVNITQKLILMQVLFNKLNLNTVGHKF
jgi:hypothetical protein